VRAILTILLLGPFVPRRVAERTQSAGRPVVWLAHATGMILGTLVLVGGWLGQQMLWRGWATSVLGTVPTTPVAGPFAVSGDELLVVALIAVGMGLTVTFLAALIVLPFAWRDEPLRDTWRQALRSVRLFAPAWMPLAALVGVCLMVFPALMRGPSPSAIHYVLMVSWTVLPLWCLYVAGGAASADRPTAAMAHEPLCESCGYLLHHVPDSRRCPECGEDVRPAIDRRYRWFPPAPSSHTWMKDATFPSPGVSAWTRPGAFFSQVQLTASPEALVRRAALAHASAALVGWVILIIGAAVILSPIPGEFLPVSACMVSACITAALGLWCAGAGIVGLLASAIHGRNLVRAALIVAAYTSPYYLVWAVAFPGTFILLIALQSIFRTGFWPVSILLTLNIGMALIYISGVWRRMRYVRYGNWRFAEVESDPAESVIADAEVPVL
jgi:hypothetical protein